MAKKRRTRGPIPQESQKTVIPWKPDLWIYLALLVSTFAVYAQARHFDFVNYDDPEYVKNTHTLQGLTPSGAAWAFTSREAANWLPLTRLSHMLDVQLFGGDAGMHHLMSVLLHAAAAMLLFAFLSRATGTTNQTRWASAFVAFVFAMHPLHVESVAWIAERKDVLNAFFWFLALWSYVRYVQRPGWGRYLLVLGAFALGLMAKPMIVTLPFVLLLIDFWPLRRFWRIREKIPFFALSAVAAIVTYQVQQGSRAVKTLSAFPLELRIENALISCVTYIEKTFWPSGLAVFYPYPTAIAAWKAVLAGAVIAGVSIFVFSLWRTRPYLVAGWLWFIGTLVPVIGLVQVGAQARADRYMYIPMVGLSIMLAWGGMDVAKHWPRVKPVMVGLAVTACTLCAVMSTIQISYWRNSESLFAHALAVTTGNYVAEHNFGLAISDAPGRLPEAIAHYRAALAIRPDSVEARTDLGNGLAQLGRFTEALEQYETALRIAPDCEICRGDLQVARTQMAAELLQKGVALEKSGQTQQAIEQFEAALQVEPQYAEAHNDLGVALGTLGQTARAIEQFEAALRIKPDYEDASYNLKLARGQNGNSK